jgi:hypothetical protein
MSDFKGKYSLSIVGRDAEYAAVSGSLILNIDELGSADGTFEDAAGKVHRVIAKVDEYGELTGTVRGQGVDLTVSAKLAPLSKFESVPGLKTSGQVFLLFDAKEHRTIWVGRLSTSASKTD